MNTVLIKVILFILIIAANSIAGTTGKITGRVYEEDTGDPVIGANIIIQGTNMGAAADLKGRYFILGVPPGTYTLRVSSIGYTTYEMRGVKVFSDRTTTHNFALKTKVLEMSEVVVTATRPIVEKDRTNSAAYVTSEQIEALPFQEVEDIIQLQTGITKDASGKFHMRGGRAGEIAYLVDGVPITDQFRGGSSIEIENNWIQELQVISGTFNAEYGQAQSGVINVVTKEGRRNYSGKVTLWAGDHISSHSDVFMNIDKLNLGEYNGEISLGGPLKLLPSTTFFINGRFYNRQGWLYGQRRTRIEDTWPIQAYVNEAQKRQTDEERLVGVWVPDSLQTGDGAYVALNPLRKYSTYFNLNMRPFNSLKLSYSLFADHQTWKSYSDSRRYAPDGIPKKWRTGFDHIFSLTHTLSKRTFYKLNFSYFSKKNESYLFENPFDSGYQGWAFSSNGFYFGGTSNGHSQTNNTTMLAKFDFTSQVDRVNLVKMGLEFKRHKLDYHSFSTISRGPVYEPPQLEVPAQNTSGNNVYTQWPIEASAYVQDKVELDEIIFNAGLRFDYWHARADVLVDPEAITDPNNGLRISSARTKSKARYQISPRFGLAYPISDKGVIHVSYGHFFQTPRFSYIFTNSEFEVELGDLETIMGNANLKPEKTIAYEIGFQQELSPDWGLQITVYYKDIKNLLGQEIINTRDKKIYARYINRDYGNVRGVSIALEKRYSSMFAGTIDYTFQIAKGNASDPNSVFYDFQSHPPRESEKQVLPLDWDQRHTLNPTIMIGDPKSWNIGIIGRFETGQPYTPSNPGSALTTQFRNSERKPFRFQLDLNIYKRLILWDKKIRFFVKIFNALDRLNEVYVYSSSGNARYPYRTLAARDVLLRNPNFTIDEIDLRPDYYSQPRRIIVGFSWEF